jgi:DNA-binding XRE family transcriptional regulator
MPGFPIRNGKTAAQYLGEVIAWHREHSPHVSKLRIAAKLCGVSESTFEAWEDGRAVPNSREWWKLCKAVNHRLSEYNQLAQQARTERQESIATMEQPTTNLRIVTTNLGEKLRQAQAAAAVEPAPTPLGEPRPEPAPLKPGAIDPATGKRVPPVRKCDPALLTKEAREERTKRARELIRENPSIRIEDVKKTLQAEFGLSINESTISKIKSEHAKRLQRAEERAAAPPAPAKPKTAAVATARPASTEDTLGTAVNLILDAIPNLASLSLTVSAEGEASVSFAVREVRVIESAGKFTVGKK